MAAASNPQNTPRGVALHNLHFSYLKKLEESMKQLTDNYGYILQSAKINDKVQNTRENLQLEIYTSNIVSSAESLLKMINELKYSILVNDFETMNENVASLREKHKRQIHNSNPEIQKLSKELADSIEELEKEHYDLDKHKKVKRPKVDPPALNALTSNNSIILPSTISTLSIVPSLSLSYGGSQPTSTTPGQSLDPLSPSLTALTPPSIPPPTTAPILDFAIKLDNESSQDGSQSYQGLSLDDLNNE